MFCSLDISETTKMMFYGYTIFLGLSIGSFLNVAIHRIPIMLKRNRNEWLYKKGLTVENAGDDFVDGKYTKRYNLAFPRSACPCCNKPIKAVENIPILSYLFLRGKCSGCKTKIDIRYLLIELNFGIIFTVILMKAGPTMLSAFLILLFATIYVAGMIAYDYITKE